MNRICPNRRPSACVTWLSLWSKRASHTDSIRIYLCNYSHSCLVARSCLTSPHLFSFLFRPWFALQVFRRVHSIIYICDSQLKNISEPLTTSHPSSWTWGVPQRICRVPYFCNFSWSRFPYVFLASAICDQFNCLGDPHWSYRGHWSSFDFLVRYLSSFRGIGKFVSQTADLCSLSGSHWLQKHF